MSVSTVAVSSFETPVPEKGVRKQEGAIREDRVRRAKRLIDMGLMDTDERMSEAVDGLLRDLKHTM